MHNTAHHLGHLQALVNGTSQEGQALVAYGSKKFHDSILHLLEQARHEGHHIEHGIHSHAKEVIDYFGNSRVSKNERLAQIQAHTQSGGSWKKFMRGVKHAFHKTTHWLGHEVFSRGNMRAAGHFLKDRVFTKDNISKAMDIGVNMSAAAAKA